ncbi:MAG: hypothetical protein ILP12_02515 [Lachnospiraceae bacterium]|nr:hypothetical protein [Lachnospiraceae bacterium]
MHLSTVELLGLMSGAILGFSITMIVLVMLFGLIRKPRKVYAGLVGTLLSAGLAFIAAMLLRGILADRLVKAIALRLDALELFGETGAVFAYSTAFLTALAGPLIFGIAFFVLKGLFVLLNPLIAIAFPEKEKTSAGQFFGKLIASAINAVLITGLLLVPAIEVKRVVVTLNDNESLRSATAQIGLQIGSAGKEARPETLRTVSADPSLLGAPADVSAETDAVTLGEIAEIFSGNKAIEYAEKFGGGAITEILSNTTEDGKTVTLAQRLDRAAEVAAPVIEAAADPSSASSDAALSAIAKALSGVSKALDNDPGLRAAAAELIAVGAGQLKEKGVFLGIRLDPADTPMEQALTDAALESLSRITEENLPETIESFAKLASTLEESGVSEMLASEDADILQVLSQPGTVSGLLETLRGNEVVQPLADALISAGVDSVSEMLGLDEDTQKSLKDKVSIDLSELTNEQAEQIEKIVAAAGAIAESVKDKTDEEILTDLDTDALEELIAAVDASGLIEGGSDAILDILLDSEVVKNSGLVDDETAAMIREKGADSAASAVGVVQRSYAIVSELAQEEADEAAVEEHLGWLLEHVNEDTAEVIGSQITEEKLSTFGIQGSKALEGLIKTLIEEMGQAQGDASVDTAAETAALTKLYGIAMTAAPGASEGNLFDEGKTDAAEFVSTVFSSRIISRAMVRTAAEEGIAEELSARVFLSGSDRERLTAGINAALSGYAQASEDERADLAEKAQALAVFFGLKGSVSPAGVFTIE